ncbi:MAG: indolepyruvate ferredoxin oxidoreductase [Gammaproteobacteria bacterium]|nr:MAG: indolepyruvate ferredoxin oxidoreductase [Gammaproteobacteria bacterium]
MNKSELFLGDEALAQGALDAGISGAYAYPGTPSTEILEYIQSLPETAENSVHCDWSSNEKTAMEEALGMSYAGKRAIACMKHVGLNVAADAFVNSAITGANGGLIVIVADDPSMHSSQNEQDTRFYAKFAGVPLLEPANQQEAYDMVFAGFELSEKMKLPVIIRLTTRLAHSRGNVIRKDKLQQNEIQYPEDDRQFILLPANARRNYDALIEKQKELTSLSNSSEYNTLNLGAENSEMGIIATGIAINYVAELFGGRDAIPYPYLAVRQYPIPAQQIQEIFSKCDKILFVEEGAPFIEEMACGILPNDLKISGRLDGTLPRTGELNPDAVAKALGIATEGVAQLPEVCKPRPPQLCKACPHIDSYNFINEIIAADANTRVFADIGCYTLGALPPYNAIHTTVDMGASITMAKGAADAGVHPSLAVIGDSTFGHSGITGLLDACYENTKMVVLILDNDTTAMTGTQDSIVANGILDKLVNGCGVNPENVHVLNPLPKNHEENTVTLKKAIDQDGVSVIIARRPCIQIRRSN